jgi:hypothetical protein
MRHFLAYIMLTIFSFQILPVKEIGKILFKSQLTEELHEDCAECNNEVKFKEPLPFKVPPVYHIRQLICFDMKLAVAIHKASLIMHQHFPDILVPPPNSIC